MFTARKQAQSMFTAEKNTVHVPCEKIKAQSMFTARKKAQSMFTAGKNHSPFSLRENKSTVYVHCEKKAQSMFTASNRTNINSVVSIQYIHNISVSIV